MSKYPPAAPDVGADADAERTTLSRSKASPTVSEHSSPQSPPTKRVKRAKPRESEESYASTHASSSAWDIGRRTKDENVTVLLGLEFVRLIVTADERRSAAAAAAASDQLKERLRVVANRERFYSSFGNVAWKAYNDATLYRQNLGPIGWRIAVKGVVASFEMKVSSDESSEIGKQPDSISTRILGQKVSELLSLFYQRLVSMNIIDKGEVDFSALATLSESDRT